MPESARRFDDPDEEDSLFSRLESRRQTLDVERSRVTPQMATRASNLASQYPWMPAGVTSSLASAGFDMDAELAKATAKLSAKKKSKSGLGWHSFGEVVGAVGGALGKVSDVASTFGEYVGLDAVRDYVGESVQDVKPVARGAFTALETGAQEMQGLVRGVGAEVSNAGRTLSPSAMQGRSTRSGVAGEVAETDGSTVPMIGENPRSGFTGEGFGAGPQSTGAIALGKLFRGDKVDLGEGFLPGGEVRKEQIRNARAALSIDGHAATPGRILAYTVFEPGTKPYDALSGLVDLAGAIYADPASMVLGKTSAIRQARKVFQPEDVGLVAGRRKTVLPAVANEWLTSGDGSRVVDHLAGEKSFDRAWKALGKKVPVETVVKLVDADTPDEVRAILRPELGITIREKPKVTLGQVGGLGVGVKRRLESVRLLQQMPGAKIDPNDLDQAVSTLDLFQKNAKFTAEQIAVNNEKMARTVSRSERLAVVKDVMAQTADVLVTKGKTRAEARRMTTMFVDSLEDARIYNIDEIGETAWGRTVVVDGVEQLTPTPHLVVETLQQAIPLPSARELRKATSRLHKVFESGVVEVTESALDGFMQGAWKRWVLLRPAWPGRVIGEEQVRMGSSGLDSAFVHPLSYLAWVVSDKSLAGRVLGKVGVKAGRGHVDMLGTPFDDGAAVIADEVSAFQKAQSRRWGGYNDSDVVRFKGKARYRRGEEFYPRAWASEITEMASDPVARRVAGGWSPGDRVPGGLTGNHVEDAKRWFWDGPGKKFRLDDLAPVDDQFLNREFSDRYIDSVYKRLSVKTGDDSDLIGAVATGKLGGDSIANGLGVSKNLVKRLTAMADEGLGPQMAKGDMMAHAKKSAGSKAWDAYDQTTTRMFTFLMGRPTNYLSRSPAFRQFYWKRAEELLPFMDEPSRAQMLIAARDAKLSRQQLRQMASRIVDRPAGTLEFADADDVAKGFGLDSTRELLYDLSNRSQFGDITRNIFPFAEAWIEVMTTWARIGVENPRVIRRAQLGIEGGRGSGFFYTDDNGEEVFAYPGTAKLTEMLTGVPAPLKGQVKGLSIATSLLPGFGPVVQIPASQLIPAKPEWDEVRKMILPYGDVETGGGMVETVFPGWLKKMKVAFTADPETDRMLGSTIISVAASLVESGEYSTNSEDEIARLLDAAEDKARVLVVLRALGQSIAPSAPSFEFLATDKEGKTVTAQFLALEFHKLEKQDYDNAPQKFLEMFGDDAVLYMQGKSRALIPAAPATEEASKWARANPGVAKKFPNVYGLFAPQGDDDLDLTAFSRQFDAAEREALTPEQAVKLSNATIGRMLYNTAKKRMGDRNDKEATAWLRTIRTGIENLYPGFNDSLGLTDKKKPKELIQELELAVKDRALAKTDTGKAIKVYLAARTKALAAAEADGLSPSGLGSAKSARYLRDWLRTIAEGIKGVYPEFGMSFERVFEREFTADDTEDVEEGAA